MTSTPTADDIHVAARTTVAALAAADITCCLVGSAACYQWGNTRVPNDVDILILSPGSSQSVEEIKARLASSDPATFSLSPPEGKPHATYRKLWCAVPPTGPNLAPDADLSTGKSVRCNIDICFPGPETVKLPPVPPALIASPRGLPVIPLLAALLHKVIAWRVHALAGRVDKQSNDVSDILRLLEVVATRGLDAILVDEGHGTWYPDWFARGAFEGIARFVEEFPESKRELKAVEVGLILEA
ncbi:hypothetical protein GGX14DRAFT_465211 [Mycena pura]|uniref:Uncharacterized protein n=1 Tax=Mycena pura TaxID=153505 RepID=A0AAD6Y9V9_9AGAR|nr:hypothetical protein GGX14DRAFT_465211 [Mycena pura]